MIGRSRNARAVAIILGAVALISPFTVLSILWLERSSSSRPGDLGLRRRAPLDDAHFGLRLLSESESADYTVDDAVDVVYTWVNGSDPAWLASAAPIFAAAADVDGASYSDAMAHKYRDWHELLYSMRSVYAYAPWVRRIYIVTSGPSQVPAWLNASHPRVRVVHHAALFDDPAVQLPTFNSYAIESVLHHIPGLSNFFLYLNQDFLLARPANVSVWLETTTARSPATYIAYYEYLNKMPEPCTRAVEAAVLDSSAVAAPAFERCRSNAGNPIWDAYVSESAFGVRLSRHFSHTPHLWERRVMYAVETRISPHLAVSRRNRLRDPRSDVNVHVQYESWRILHQAVAGEPRVVGLPAISAAMWAEHFDGARRRPLHRLQTLTRGMLWRFNIIVNSLSTPYYDELDAEMASPRRPLFVTLDDHLKLPSRAMLAFHGERLGAFYERHWPASIGAPWEVDAAVPRPVTDPTQFRATPPPEPPTPTRTPSSHGRRPRPVTDLEVARDIERAFSSVFLAGLVEFCARY